MPVKSLRLSLPGLGSLLIGLATGVMAPRAQCNEPRPDAVLAQGAQIAQELCSTCHLVAPDQRFPPLLDQPTPSFMDIAARPGIDAKYIQRFITTTHWDEKSLPMRMPNLMITPAQSVAVSRYILTLRKR